MASAGESTGDGTAQEGAVEQEDQSARARYRAGEQAMSLLATPLNLLVLRALSERPMRLAELRRATGLPAQTTLRGHLGNLSELGVLIKRPTQQMPYTIENKLTSMGRELLDVADLLEAWLRQSPGGPVSLESGAAKGVVKAFVDGWGSTMMRGLASRPMSLTELDRRIVDLSYPALERRLSSMRMAGLIEARSGAGVGTPYTVTDWARKGVAPLTAASHCERVHMRERAAPVTQIDIEAAFLLATPLVGVPEDQSGTCQLEVEAGPDGLQNQAGIQVEVCDGQVVACDSHLGPKPGAYAVGSTAKWFSAIREGQFQQLRYGGGRRLAEALVIGLHATFIGS